MTLTEDNPPPQPAELLARLFGTSVEEMREHPEAAREKFAAAFRELAESHEPGSPGGDGARGRGAAREMMRRLRRELAASGEEVPAELDELPGQLADVAERLGGATPAELAGLLRGLAGAVETPTREAGESGEAEEAGEDNGGRANLDEVAAWFETNFGTLLGFERRRRREDARMQAEYREAAKRSIAASLREHGIQPLSTDPEPVAPRASIKRQRLFWQEFAAAAGELRALVAGGEEDTAQQRVAEMLDAFDLDIKIRLTREGEEAVLAFIPSDDVAANVALQVVVRDSPRLAGWRFVRGSRYGTTT